MFNSCPLISLEHQVKKAAAPSLISIWAPERKKLPAGRGKANAAMDLIMSSPRGRTFIGMFLKAVVVEFCELRD